jgi:hypothetical protein
MSNSKKCQLYIYFLNLIGHLISTSYPLFPVFSTTRFELLINSQSDMIQNLIYDCREIVKLDPDEETFLDRNQSYLIF